MKKKYTSPKSRSILLDCRGLVCGSPFDGQSLSITSTSVNNVEADANSRTIVDESASPDEVWSGMFDF